MNTPHQPYKRIVAKLGTNLLTSDGPNLDEAIMARLVDQVARLHGQGTEVVIVSSGAVAAGAAVLGKAVSPRGVGHKQVLASVGQSRLMNDYQALFSRHSITVAQALLTKTDLADRSGYLNARNTLLSLLDLRVIVIVNENDVVAVDELGEACFGDNDNLSAMVANLVDADLLLLLTNTTGLYTADPQHHVNARLITAVEKIDTEIERLAADTSSSRSTGGMATKVEAAKLATISGVTVVIADGREPDIILRLAAGEATGTRFLPAGNRLESRKRWMLSGLCTRGKLIVDTGAARALKKQHSSLLAAGIKQVEGDCQRGDIVNITDEKGTHLGYGISNYSSKDIGLIMGAHSGKIVSLLGYDYGSEVVHRNNLAVI
jgi:glutamate 5-kinase